MEEKYLKYKLKYLNLKKQQQEQQHQKGGHPNDHVGKYYRLLNQDSINVEDYQFMENLYNNDDFYYGTIPLSNIFTYHKTEKEYVKNPEYYYTDNESNNKPYVFTTYEDKNFDENVYHKGTQNQLYPIIIQNGLTIPLLGEKSYKDLIIQDSLSSEEYNAINDFYDKYKRKAVGSLGYRLVKWNWNDNKFFPEGPPSTIFKCTESTFSRIGKGFIPCARYEKRKVKNADKK